MTVLLIMSSRTYMNLSMPKFFIAPMIIVINISNVDLSIVAAINGRQIEDGPILVGVCAMDQKARSVPMTEMLNRLESFTANGLTEFKVVYFGNEMLLEEPIEHWPLCDALIAFYSDGFPLRKVQQYAALRKPVVLNDLKKQELLNRM